MSLFKTQTILLDNIAAIIFWKIINLFYQERGTSICNCHKINRSFFLSVCFAAESDSRGVPRVFIAFDARDFYLPA